MAVVLVLAFLSAACSGASREAAGLAMSTEGLAVDSSITAATVGFYLKMLAKRELGVPEMQSIFDEAEVKRREGRRANRDMTARELAAKMSRRLARKLDMFYGNLETTAESAASHIRRANGVRHLLDRTRRGEESGELLPPPCCSPANKGHDIRASCTVIHAGSNATSTLRFVATMFEYHVAPRGTKRQFFMSSDGSSHIEYPGERICGRQSDVRHRDAFVRSIHPYNKRVVIVLDRGIELTPRQLDVGRAVAGYIVAGLTSRDRIRLITLDRLSRRDESPGGCPDAALATSSRKLALYKRLNNVHRSGRYEPSDHVAGVRKARMVFNGSNETSDLFYITGGRYGRPGEARDVLRELDEVDGHVRVHVYYVGRESDPALARIRRLAGARHNIIPVDSTYMLSYTLGDVFAIRDEPPTEDYQVLAPRFDDFNDEAIVTMTRRVSTGSKVHAIVGVDAYYEYLFEDMVFFDKSMLPGTSYAIVLDKTTGAVVYHPSMYDGDSAHRKDSMSQLARLADLEHAPLEVRNRILGPGGGPGGVVDGIHKSYHFMRGQIYVVVVVTKTEPTMVTPAAMRLSSMQPRSRPAKQTDATIHNRLDLLPAEGRNKLCRHMHLPATLETGSVYLSPIAFEDPFDVKHGANLTADDIENYMAYLTFNGSGRAFVNPGFRDGIHEDVRLLAQITPTWKNRSYDSGLNNYIVKRYAATPRGVFYGYPGAPRLTHDKEPVNEGWYLTAQHYPGRVVLSRPRLDPGGAGYVVTLSQAVQSMPETTVRAVMGLDLTLGYVYKLLIDTMPPCASSAARCFLFDQHGYIIVHPAFFQQPGSALSDRRHHLTQLEHLVASRILTSDNLVERSRCRLLTSMVVWRGYTFNMSRTEPVRSWAGDCERFQVSPMPGTNAFLAIVRTSAGTTSNCTVHSEASTFCPCNSNTGRCIACDWGSAAGPCECPCRCPLDENCAAREDEPAPPICPAVDYQDDIPWSLSAFSSRLLEGVSLPACFDTDCGRRASKDTCFGVIGCSWCELAADGSRLPEPHCSGLDICFGGRLGRDGPYNRREGGPAAREDVFRPTPSMGPIAVAIVAAFLFLGASAYCIRNNDKVGPCVRSRGARGAGCVDRRASGRQPGHGSMLHVARFEEVVEDYDDDDDELHELAVASGSDALVVSPYRMNPGYRKPGPATDSDHGYSTMTPIDSEVVVPYVESASARERRARRQASKVSSPTQASIGSVPRGATANKAAVNMVTTNNGCSTTTVLPPPPPCANRNQFIVAATVHMVDTQ